MNYGSEDGNEFAETSSREAEVDAPIRPDVTSNGSAVAVISRPGSPSGVVREAVTKAERRRAAGDPFTLRITTPGLSDR